MKMKLLALFCTTLLFISCKKAATTDDATNATCPTPDSITPGNNGTNNTVVVGWPLELSAPSSYVGYYNWFSPSGGSITQAGFTTPYSNVCYKAVSTFADSGTYKLEVKFDNCVRWAGTTKVKIIAPPTPPCNTTNNTSTSTVIGVGGDTYTNRDFSNNNVITANPGISDGTLHFYFSGNTPPKPGKYRTNGSDFSSVETEVGCWLSYFPARQFINKANQDVYVNSVNGKLQISFCGCSFTNPLGSAAITISAKITQP